MQADPKSLNSKPSTLFNYKLAAVTFFTFKLTVWEPILQSIAKAMENLYQKAGPRSAPATILGTFCNLRHSSALWGLTFQNQMETRSRDLFIEAAEYKNKDGAREWSL